jgi:hypothetical protein
MPQILSNAVSLIVDLYDSMITSIAAAPILGLHRSTFKATALVIGAASTLFSAGAGFAMFLVSYSGLPDRVSALEANVERVAQDACVIRARVEATDPVRCFLFDR